MKQSELNKISAPIIRTVGKAHGYKAISGFLYKVHNDLLFSVNLLPGKRKAELCLSHMLAFKPVVFDDIFWKIMRIEEDFQKVPFSRRVNGAFTAYNQVLHYDVCLFQDVQKLEGIVEQLLKKYEEIILPLSLEDISMVYLDDKHKTHYTEIVKMILFLVYQERYQDALSIIEKELVSGNDGGFIIGDDSFMSLAEAYCLARVDA